MVFRVGKLSIINYFPAELLVKANQSVTLQTVKILLGVFVLTLREKKAEISGLMLTCQNYVNLVIRKRFLT